MEVARNGDTTAVRAVLEKVSPDSKTVAFDAVHEACRGNHDECLALLLPYVETTQMGFGILLSECVHADHVACTEVLLQHWKSVCGKVAFVPNGFNIRQSSVCPAMWADAAVCRVLIDAGADVHTKDDNGRSPLHSACNSGALDVVKILVRAGAGVRATDNEGHTCLTLAVCSGHTDTVRYLVGLPDVDVNDGGGYDDALHYAVMSCNADVVQMLIDAGADIDMLDNDGRSPLLSACNSGALDVVKILVRAGAGVRARDNQGDTCLTLSTLVACSGHTDTVRYLVGLPDFDVNDGGGYHSALHYAVMSYNADVVQMLIDAGADIDTLDNEGCSPLHSACNSGALDAVKILIRAGARVRATDNEGHTCLTLAVCSGHTDTVRYLVGLPDVDVNDGGGYHSALHYAVRSYNADVAQVLLDAGADINMLDNEGRSPLHSACNSGAHDVVEILVRAGATDNHGIEHLK